MKHYLSYYQRVLQAVEWIEAGASITVYPATNGEGYAEIRRRSEFNSGDAILTITTKMWHKVNQRLGSRLIIADHLDGVFTRFKIAA